MMYELMLLAIPVAVVVYFLNKDRVPGNMPPGPEQSILFGNFKDVNTNNIHQSLYKLSQTYGPVFTLRLLFRRIVVFNTADIIRKAFQSETYKEDFNDKPCTGFYGTYLIYGHQDVLFGPYKDITFKVKSLMYKGIERLQKEEFIQAEIDELIQGFRNTSGRDFDPRSIVEKLMGELHAKINIGDIRSGDSELILKFGRSSNVLLHPSNESTLKMFPFLRHTPTNVGGHYRQVLEDREKMLKRFFDEQKDTFSPEVTRGLVDMCLHIQRSKKNPDGTPWLTDDIIRAAIIDTIGGGVIATVNSFLAQMLCLMHNPDCQKKMQSEIDSVTGKSRNLNGNDITKLPYCHAAFLESLRYNSIVPIVNHFCSIRDVEFEGHYIPKGTTLFGCFWSAHHDEKTWKDPWTFTPDRFLDDQGRLLPLDHELRRSLFPYGLGSRICVGKSLAHTRLFVYMAALLQHFDILPPENAELLLNDPNLFEIGPVLQVPGYQCRFVART